MALLAHKSAQLQSQVPLLSSQCSNRRTTLACRAQAPPSAAPASPLPEEKLQKGGTGAMYGPSGLCTKVEPRLLIFLAAGTASTLVANTSELHCAGSC